MQAPTIVALVPWQITDKIYAKSLPIIIGKPLNKQISLQISCSIQLTASIQKQCCIDILSYIIRVTWHKRSPNFEFLLILYYKFS